MESDTESLDYENWGSSENSNTPPPPVPLQRPEPLEKDRHVYRTAVYALSSGIFIGLIGSVWLASNDKEIPQILVAIASACAGALGALIAPKS
ncbi:hypothetical protein [Spartinivicinus poritis]|uniref:Transmembrane protein n=1 Tax=Spartinivicinus poritis TaxID=2994640 RepID=A0ABT5U7U7_9GAMM|nr:hypothetical protein [Spartinivicinus sp. A2-2]MDE1462444.1 hypothetical protein [Spartinivicinus sp. A2-2]